MPYLAQDIVNDCRASVLEPHPAFFSSQRMLYLINEGEKDMTDRVRGLLESNAYLSTLEGESTYDMPPNWLASEQILINLPENNQDNWRYLLPTNIEKMAQESPNYLSRSTQAWGQPYKYFIQGRQLTIFPTPNVTASNNVYMFFQSKPIPLAALNEQLNIDDTLSGVLVAYVLWRLWDQDNETDKASRWRSVYEDGIKRANSLQDKKQRNKRDRVDIISPIPFNYGGNGFGSTQGFNPLS